jgi:hypothetical protein
MNNAGKPDTSLELRYLRLCLGSQWSPSALTEAGAISASADFDWAAFRQCAWDEGAALLWYSRVRGRNLAPPALETELQAAYRENALRNTALFCKRDRVLRELRNDGLDVILLKGAALAESVYGDIALRPMIDLDLLVRPRDASAVLQRLAGEGYLLVKPREMIAVLKRLTRAGYSTSLDLEPRASPPLEYENEIAVFKPGNTRYCFDVHWSLFYSLYYRHKMQPEAQSEAQSEWFWSTTMPIDATGTPARMLGPEAQVLYLAAHLMLNHRGRGLMWWQDVGEVVWTFRGRLDWRVLCERAQACNLVLPLQCVLLDLVEHWHLPIPIAAVEQLRALRPSLREQQVYARLTIEHPSALHYFWSDLVGMPDWPGRLRYVGRKLFPSAAYMRWRFALPRPWLLPFAYPYRWWLIFQRARQHD